MERRQDTSAQVHSTPQIIPMHAQIYPEPPPMSPYADSIGWLSEGPSTSVESARLYSFPRHQTFPLFRLCLQSGLMNYSAPAEILANYCPYHQVMGHSIENCIRFKDDVQRLIGQGLIDLGIHRVNPPQPHTQQPPNRSANPGSYSVNVINATSFSGLPQSTEEELQNPYLSSQWYTNARPLQRCSFDIKNTKLIFDNFKRQELIQVFPPTPYIFTNCLELHDLIETHIREGKIDQYGNSLAPANEVSQQTYDPSMEFQAFYPEICEYYHHQLGYGQYRSKAEEDQFKMGLFQYRNGISEEAAAEPISQQAEEFVDDYHQLPPSIIEESINATFESRASEDGWVTVGPRKSSNHKKPKKSTIKNDPSKRSILKPCSDQEVISSLEALQIRNKEKNRRKNKK
ncbi:hypothetical protein Taro_012048 [Colocasia esculenta]|uniref:Uncharacterized protein n=1 Tax=Colocasia esculenta TaxID=4460 RepID=A0A843UBV5_COLES|nr:hypothetical protein [Colocasia esculenta]